MVELGLGVENGVSLFDAAGKLDVQTNTDGSTFIVTDTVTDEVTDEVKPH